MTTHEVIFQPEGKRVKVESNTSLYEAATRTGADLISICGGKGTCYKCKVQIDPSLSQQPLTNSEQNFLTKEEIAAGIRLACQVKVQNHLVVTIPESSRTGKQRLQVEGIKTPVVIEPLIQKIYLHLPEPTIEDPRSDFDRLLDELENQFSLTGLEIKYTILKDLGPFLRKCNWSTTVSIWNNNQIIALESGDSTKALYGVSIDIGTTKLAVYLINMLNGEVIAVDSAMNPQIAYGEDIISRINYICSVESNNSSEVLQKVLVQTINDLISTICKKSGISSKQIYEMTAVGNTAMHHIFLNLNPRHLSLSPYPPVIRQGINITPDKLGVQINPTGNIYCLPVIAGYNGSDNVGVLLATEIYKRDELCLALDIGTNTEVVLGNKRQILVCSCASGPAFEGATIKYGMRAASGAIEHVQIDPKTLKCDYQTIDNNPPRGICGSAIVDIMAEMLKAGVIDVTGKMNNSLESNLLRQTGDGYEYILTQADETAIGNDITITQKDVRQITLAKAAMHAGSVILMEELEVNEKNIDRVFIAGAFGNYIDVENARFIGMYPEIDLSKVEIVGNAAGTGARMALLSKKMRITAENIVKNQIKYIELAAKERFQSVYLNSTYLPYADLSKYPITSSHLKKLGKYPTKLPHIF